AAASFTAPGRCWASARRGAAGCTRTTSRASTRNGRPARTGRRGSRRSRIRTSGCARSPCSISTATRSGSASRRANRSALLHDEAVAQAGVGEKPGELLERAGELSAVADGLSDVHKRRNGRVVLVGAEAGGGKTALLRRFSDASGARVLWGACDPLFTPRPLGPLIAVADIVAGKLGDAIGAGAHEVTTALMHELTA